MTCNVNACHLGVGSPVLRAIRPYKLHERYRYPDYFSS